jgi:hypothetical protein
VIITCKKNILFPVPRRQAIVFLLFLFPVIVNAQTDTVIMADTLPSYQSHEGVKEEQPPVQVDEGKIIVEEKKTDDINYFSSKWRYGADTVIVQRKIPGDLVKQMKEEDDFWYANTELKKKAPEQQIKDESYYVPLGQRKWFQSLLWVIIIAVFAAAIMWYLMSSNVGLFRKKEKSVSGGGEEEPEMENIFAINYQKEVDKAEASGNYRLAIRLMFLRLLKVMAEKNIIQYKQDKTNFDYLLQLHPTAYYNNFFRVTRNYEYSWYGQFNVSEEAYRIVRNDFNQFDKQLV